MADHETDGPLTMAQLGAVRGAIHDALDDAEGEERKALFRAMGALCDAHGVESSEVDGICPECGSLTESITDMFRGGASAVDNFQEARDRVPTEEREVVKHPDGGTIPVETARLLAEDDEDVDGWEEVREEYEITTKWYVVSPEDDDYDVGVPATERWCIADECGWSERLL